MQMVETKKMGNSFFEKERKPRGGGDTAGQDCPGPHTYIHNSTPGIRTETGEASSVDHRVAWPWAGFLGLPALAVFTFHIPWVQGDRAEKIGVWPGDGDDAKARGKRPVRKSYLRLSLRFVE